MIVEEMNDIELKKVTGGSSDNSVVYSFKKNDRINTSNSNEYYVVEESIQTTDGSKQVKVSEHTRESAAIRTDSYVYKKAEELLNLYSLYGGRLA